jgi:hypothetical protein
VRRPTGSERQAVFRIASFKVEAIIGLRVNHISSGYCCIGNDSVATGFWFLPIEKRKAGQRKRPTSLLPRPVLHAGYTRRSTLKVNLLKVNLLKVNLLKVNLLKVNRLKRYDIQMSNQHWARFAGTATTI